jgi:single-strand DNA-binding protein
MLIGNLTRDPELRVTPKGTSICQFGLALNREYKTESGEKREDVAFVDCEAWGKTGELITKYLAKGRSAFVEGRLKLDEWEDKTSGQKRSKLKVVVEQVQFLGSKPECGAQQSQQPASDPSKSAYDKPATGNNNTEEPPPF